MSDEKVKFASKVVGEGEGMVSSAGLSQPGS